jgi:hypothetical protein
MSKAKAVGLLAHYFSLVFKANGIGWDSDNLADLDLLVDELVDAVQEERKAEETDCDRKECDYYAHYLVYYSPEVQGRKLDHDAYHHAARMCSDAQEELHRWMDENPGDPVQDTVGRYLWNRADKWEKVVAA